MITTHQSKPEDGPKQPRNRAGDWRQQSKHEQTARALGCFGR